MIYTFTGAIVCIHNNKGQILLQKRTADAPTYHSHWALFAGTVEEGEEPIETLKREMIEELEYKLQNPVFHFIVEHSGPKHFFSEKFKEGTELILHEGDTMQWFSLDEIDKLKMVEYHQEGARKIFEGSSISTCSTLELLGTSMPN